MTLLKTYVHKLTIYTLLTVVIVTLCSCNNKDKNIETQEVETRNGFTKIYVYSINKPDSNYVDETTTEQTTEYTTEDTTNTEIQVYDKFKQVVTGGLMMEDIIVDKKEVEIKRETKTADISDYLDYTGTLKGDYSVNIFTGELRTRLIDLDDSLLMSVVVATQNICKEQGIDTKKLKISTNAINYSNEYEYSLISMFDNDLYLYIAVNNSDYSVKYKIVHR
jgi:hypothetical protein